MIKRLIKSILLELLREDYQVQMAVTKIANPELARQIQAENQRNVAPPEPEWWKYPRSEAN